MEEKKGLTAVEKRNAEMSKMVHKQMVFNETIRAEAKHYDKNRSTDYAFNPNSGKSSIKINSLFITLSNSNTVSVSAVILSSKPNPHAGKL